LTYLAAIFKKTNELNVSLQERNISICTIKNRISAFQSNITFWAKSVESKEFELAPTLNEFLAESETELEERFLMELCDFEMACSEHFWNSFYLLQVTDPGREIHVKLWRYPTACQCKTAML
jgi:type IV secretory pathway VirB4 component